MSHALHHRLRALAGFAASSPWVVPSFLAVLVSLLWWPAGEAILESWDDSRWVIRNPVRNLAARDGLRAILLPHDGAWYPTTQALTWLLSLASSSAEQFALHLRWTTSLLAGASTLLLYSCLRAEGAGKGWAAFLTSAILCHPHRVENFAWASNLRDALALTLLLATVRAWQAHKGSWVLLAIGALGAKTMVGLVPLALPFLPSRRSHRGFPRLMMLYVAITATTLLWARKVYEGVATTHCSLGDSLWETLPMSACVQVQHGLGFLVPTAPSAIPAPLPLCTRSPSLLRGLLLVGLVGATVVSLRSERLRFPILWAMLVLAPVTGIASPLAFPVAWRYGLWVEVGVVLALSGLSLPVLSRKVRPVLALLSSLLILFFIFHSLSGKKMWSDDLQLWEYSHSRNSSWEVKHNLAGVVWDSGDRVRAHSLLNESAALAPHEVVVRASQAFAYALEASWPPAAAIGVKDGMMAAAEDPDRLRLLLKTRWVQSSPAIQRLLREQIKDAEAGWTASRRCAFHRRQSIE